MTDIHHATPSQIAEHRAHMARQHRLGCEAIATPRIKPILTPKAVIMPPEPHFWFSITEEIEPVAECQLTCAQIKGAVAAHFNVSVRDLISARRTANIVLPRHIGIYLAKELTLLSLPEIGRHFGNRDHTTVLYSVHKITTLLSTPEVVEALKQIRRAIRAS